MPLLLGKAPARIDARTMKLSTILREPPPLPLEYDIDKALGIQDNRMFANDVYGLCVLASAAHITLHFETFEQGGIDIADKDVIDQYLAVTNNEAKGPGMVMLDWMNYWRKTGFLIGGKRHKIHAFASVNWKDHQEVKACIYLLRGIHVGFMLPRSADTQFNKGQPWTLVAGPEGAYGSWGGHAMDADAYQDVAMPVPEKKTCCPVLKLLHQKRLTVAGYTIIGPVVTTWGKRQQMDWAFWDAMCEEAYGIIDERDEWLDPATSPLNVEALESTLKQITE